MCNGVQDEGTPTYAIFESGYKHVKSRVTSNGFHDAPLCSEADAVMLEQENVAHDQGRLCHVKCECRTCALQMYVTIDTNIRRSFVSLTYKPDSTYDIR